MVLERPQKWTPLTRLGKKLSRLATSTGRDQVVGYGYFLTHASSARGLPPSMSRSFVGRRRIASSGQQRGRGAPPRHAFRAQRLKLRAHLPGLNVLHREEVGNGASTWSV